MSKEEKRDIVYPEDLKNIPVLPFEDMSKATEEMKQNYLNILDFGKNTFGQSRYSEKHFVLNSQLTPHRTHRQAMLHYDGKMHALAEAQANKAKALAKLKKAEQDVNVLERLYKKIEGMTQKPEKLPSYKYECMEGDKVIFIEFNAQQILDFYDAAEWEDCKRHLLLDLETIITLKKADISQIRRGQFQQEKLEIDARREVEWYEKEILPKTLAASQAALLNGIDFEKEEEIYWQLRQKRFIECKQLEQITGIPHDYWESISQMPETAAANLIEFMKENARLLTQGSAHLPQGINEIPNSFRYRKHVIEANNVLTSGKIEETRSLVAKSQAERTSFGGICLGLLFRSQKEAEERGASDPEGMLFSPRGFDVKPIYVWGMRTDEARNFVVTKALEGNANWVFFVDDDVIIPKMALRDLIQIAIENDWPIVAGDYPLKKNVYESASLVIVEKNGKGVAVSPVFEANNGWKISPDVIDASFVEQFDFNGESRVAIKVNGILATGCMLIRADVLRKMGGDWFREYRKEIAPGVNEMIKTDDAPFTSRAIELGFQPRLIPWIKCQHVDFKNKRVYGSKLDGVEYCINNRANPFLIAQESGNANPRCVIYVPRRAMNFIPFVDLGSVSRPKCIQFAIGNPPIGTPWAETWTFMARQAFENNADYMIIVEDDMIVPKNAVSCLLKRIQENQDFAFICGSYVRKDTTNESAHIVVSGVKNVVEFINGEAVTKEVSEEKPFPKPFEERGLVENNHLVCFGCSIIRTRVFADLPSPWFFYAPAGSQVSYQGRQVNLAQTITHDAFFVRRLFGAGYRSAVDTDLQCLHVDINTGRVFGSPKYVTEDFKLRKETADLFAINQDILQRIKCD